MEPMRALVPKVPRKYRVSVDCAGFNPKSIKTEVQNGKLVIRAKEETKEKEGDFSTKEFKKTYNLPEHAETDKMVSFVTGYGQLVVEVPLRQQGRQEEDLFPKVVDTKDGGKEVLVDCMVPQNINPDKIQVTCKDRDIIVKAEDTVEKPDTVSRMYYYKRCTLPENTDVSNLKCQFDKNKLSIKAPINPAMTNQRQIPIEHKKEAIRSQ